jgi:hypothetical protein
MFEAKTRPRKKRPKTSLPFSLFSSKTLPLKWLLSCREREGRKETGHRFFLFFLFSPVDLFSIYLLFVGWEELSSVAVARDYFYFLWDDPLNRIYIKKNSSSSSTEFLL